MTTNEKIAELLDWFGLSQQELADRTGIPRGSISSYVTGRAAVSIEMAYKIAEGLGVSPWTVLNSEPLPADPLDLSQAEKELVTNIRSLTKHQREIIDQNVQLMLKHNREK